MKLLGLLLLLFLPSPVVFLFTENGFANKTLEAWNEVERIVNSTCGDATCTARNFTSDERCTCDDDCWKYGDCCVDAARDAFFRGVEPEERWICQDVPAQWVYSIYMVGRCPSKWTDEEVRLKCRKQVDTVTYSYLLDVPVVSITSNITYVNVYCALCNQDTDLFKVNLTLKCYIHADCENLLPNATYMQNLSWQIPNHVSQVIYAYVDLFENRTKFLHSTNSRQCQKTANICQSHLSDPTSKYFCSAFAYNIFYSGVIIKNPLCIYSCNSTETKFECEYSYGGIGLSKDIAFGAAAPGFAPVSFTFLLDFNEIHGEYVGTQRRCKNGEVYDPINKECVIFLCGQYFEKIDGKCVEKEELNDINSTDIFLNSACRKILITDFVWLNNQTVYVNETYTQYDRHELEIVNSSAVLICADEDENYVNKFSIIQTQISLIFTVASLVCLALHIVVYSCLPKMRNLPGINLLSLSCILFVGQFLLLGVKAVSHFQLCQAMAISLHYAFLASFVWMNVISIDIHQTFTSTYHSSKSDLRTNYMKYGLYAWISPLLIVIAAIIIDNTDLLPDFRPRYGYHICWISRRRGLLVFFAIPLAILLIANIIFFTLTSRAICFTLKESKSARRQHDNVRFFLYLKLAMIMGLTWIFGFVASATESTVLWYFFVIVNASQGIYIFIAFTLKFKILKLIAEKLNCNSTKKSSTESSQKNGLTVREMTSSSTTTITRL